MGGLGSAWRTRWAVWAVAAVVVAAVVFDRAEAAPAISFDRAVNRKAVVEDVQFDLSYELVYNNEEETQGDRLYSRVLWRGELVASSSVPLYTEGAGLARFIIEREIVINARGNQELLVEVSLDPEFNDRSSADYTAWLVPGPVTLFPAILVALVAALTREVMFALYAGTLAAAFIVEKYNPYQGYLRVLDTYLPFAVGNYDHAFILLFTASLSGLVATMNKAGGNDGFADLIGRMATSRRGVQFAVYVQGFVVFFDDYANTLILGNTMRVLSDFMLISREKLAFIVDATAAPIASLAPISSWIGFEVQLIQAQLDLLVARGADLEAGGINTNAYVVFLETIESRFYPIFMLIFTLVLILSMRDFGSMLRAERRAYDDGKLVGPDAKIKVNYSDVTVTPREDTPYKWWNGLVPILLVVALVVLGMVLTGQYNVERAGDEATAYNMFGHADTYSSLMYGSITTLLIAWLMYRLQYVVGEEQIVVPVREWLRLRRAPGRPLMTWEESLASFLGGIHSIVPQILVLILAWSIGHAVVDSGADLYFASAIAGTVDPRGLPVMTFVIAAGISFCTGTSWGTMSILFPLAVPTAWAVSQDPHLFKLVISAVLSGAVFGDHCTPISDTTILSSMASGCDIIHHTLTQLPYAVIVGCLAAILGYLPAGYEAWSNGAAVGIGAGAVICVVLFVGVRIDHPKRRNDIFTFCYLFVRKRLLHSEPPKSSFEYSESADEYYVDIFRWNFWPLPKLGKWWKRHGWGRRVAP